MFYLERIDRDVVGNRKRCEHVFIALPLLLYRRRLQYFVGLNHGHEGLVFLARHRCLPSVEGPTVQQKQNWGRSKKLLSFYSDPNFTPG